MIRVQSTRPTIKLLPFVLFGSAPPSITPPGKGGLRATEKEEKELMHAAGAPAGAARDPTSLVSRVMLAGMKKPGVRIVLLPDRRRARPGVRDLPGWSR